MNKNTLYSAAHCMNDGKFYIINVHDLEPHGVLVCAYDHTTSKEYVFPISERDVSNNTILLFFNLYIYIYITNLLFLYLLV